MTVKQAITRKQLDKIAAVLRFRGATLADAQKRWQAMPLADRQWWREDTKHVLAHAGLVVAPKTGGA